MADKLVSQDPSNPGVAKVNGPTLTSSNTIPLTGLDVTGAANGNVVVLAGGVWTPGSGGASSDTASNVGVGTGTIFKQKTGANFEFKTLVAGTNITLTNGASDITINNSLAAGSFTSSFTSTDQVITQAGSLTLAHALGGMPTLVQLRIKCLAAQFNYVIGDEIIIHSSVEDSASAFGATAVPDATNIFIRYGNVGGVFQVHDKTTGNAGNTITAASWAFIVRAWR